VQLTTTNHREKNKKMLRLATVFASIALVSAKAVEEEAAEVDFEELFEGRFLSGNGTNTTTTTTTTTTTVSTTTTTTTTTGSTTTTTTTAGTVAATDKTITVALSATIVLSMPTGSTVTTDDLFIAQLNMAVADRTDATCKAVAKGCWDGYYAMVFPDGSQGTTVTTAQRAASSWVTSFSAASSRKRRLATIGTGKTLDMEFSTTGLTAAQATTATTAVAGIDATAATTGLATAMAAAFAADGLDYSATVTSLAVTAPTITTTTTATDTATTTAASSAAAMGLPIVAALFSAVLMF
jgi:hypothetical protein